MIYAEQCNVCGAKVLQQLCLFRHGDAIQKRFNGAKSDTILVTIGTMFVLIVGLLLLVRKYGDSVGPGVKLTHFKINAVTAIYLYRCI